MTDYLDELLAEYRMNSADYGQAEKPLSDHLPMAVAALSAMGASKDRTTQWASNYAQIHRLRRADHRELSRRNDWSARLQKYGRDRVLRESIVTLRDGIGAAAFHPLIRAAYAITREDDVELAAALEAWEHSYLDLPASPDGNIIPVADAIARLAERRISPPTTGLISDRMAHVARDPSFAKLTMAIPNPSGLDDLARAAASTFAQTGSFVALHIMTGTHALRILAPYCEDQLALTAAFWAAYAAASQCASQPPTLDPLVLEGLRIEKTPPWEHLHAAAIEHEDEHVIKATYTAWQLDEEIDDPVFRTAAHRYLVRMHSGLRGSFRVDS